eukprot:CAMPEP_0183464428 /NCGR_PEP_ID=MMETSP0370-20130417/145391_1 /TAXON_ID=268820 /ORGANISM="Peridinium aciculiferum, Strain PAER-2" /LENGTH=57 /DNA_ID=CAMNT_0025656585 /DNA_START=40 /DNA_END=213 /DNA_ORIENTATION=-
MQDRPMGDESDSNGDRRGVAPVVPSTDSVLARSWQGLARNVMPASASKTCGSQASRV